MRKWTALLLALLLLAACAPAAEGPAPENGWEIWFAVRQNWNQQGWDREDTSSVAPEIRAWDGEPTALELMETLLAGPESGDLYAPFPRGVEVRSVTVKGDGVALVDLSEQYGGLSGFNLTVADYCIALTLCQLPQVEAVRVLVEGEIIPYRGRQLQQAGDALLTDISEEPDAFLAVLYFPNSHGGLTAEYRRTERASNAAATVLRELLLGPRNETSQPLPPGVRPRSIRVLDGICQVNLSQEFLALSSEDDESAMLVLYALVDSLCALGGISQVQLLVEGSPVESYGGVPTNAPLNANLDLIQSGT